MLSAGNPVSKRLRSENFSIQFSIKSVVQVLDFLKKYQQNGFNSVKITNQELAAAAEIPPGFTIEVLIQS